mmetsp:Transcript_18643/g.46998  ORF Transcript_18643/g.46998 Transcript_18643/m.46998 type:complete len:232 (-) Transcript_18643:744-1439(-)
MNLKAVIVVVLATRIYCTQFGQRRLSLLNVVGKGRNNCPININARKEHIFVNSLVVVVQQDWSIVHGGKPKSRNIQNTDVPTVRCSRENLRFNINSCFLTRMLEHFPPAVTHWRYSMFFGHIRYINFNIFFSSPRLEHNLELIQWNCRRNPHIESRFCLRGNHIQAVGLSIIRGDSTFEHRTINSGDISKFFSNNLNADMRQSNRTQLASTTHHESNRTLPTFLLPFLAPF